MTTKTQSTPIILKAFLLQQIENGIKTEFRARKNLEEINELGTNAGVETWLLTSTSYDQFDAFRHDNQLAFPFYFATRTQY